VWTVFREFALELVEAVPVEKNRRQKKKKKKGGGEKKRERDEF